MNDHSGDDDGIERQREHFNSIAEQYRKGRLDKNHRRVKSLIWKEALADLTGLNGRRIRMLEPMCGYAEGRQIIADNFEVAIDYDAFDFSDVIVEELERLRLDGTIWQADVTKFSPDAGRYDLILLIGGLHHVPDAAPDVVRKLSTGLAPGGLFVNFEPTYGNGLFRRIRESIYNRNAIFDKATERSFDVDELRNMFVSAGLSEVRCFYPGLLAYTLYYNTYAFPRLNIGGEGMVNACFRLDRLFMNNELGRALSFATMSIWQRRD